MDASANLRQRIGSGAPVVGTFIKLSGLEIIDAVAASGLDFAVLDMEHSRLTESEARTQLVYASAIGLPCLVRVPEVDPGEIGRYLEARACGLQLSGARTVSEVEALVRAARFPPRGERSASTSHPGADFGRVAVAEYVQGPYSNPLLVIQIESVEAAGRVESLLTADIDICFVGVVDLSVDVGAPGDLAHASVRELMTALAAAARRAGVGFGHHLITGMEADPEARYLTAGTDLSVLADGLYQLAGDIRKSAIALDH